MHDQPGTGGTAAAGRQSPAGLDLSRLEAFLARERPGLAGGALRATLIPGGRSNLTYLLTDGAREWVLRRPPLGHVLATAHDVGREYRVMTALGGTAVPVPATVLHCPDPEVLGAPFYLMDKVDGEVVRSRAQSLALPPQQRVRLAYTLVDTLADLHLVDPVRVGLADFGRPDGFLARQVRRWTTQLDKSRSRDLPGVEQLAADLADRVPGSGRATIVHGDYRLDNVLVRDGVITAVLDWEMSTLGDPLTDIGLLLVYWDALSALDGPVSDAIGTDLGYPDGATLARRYADRTGVELAALDWYIAFGLFKLAVILEGIHYRYTLGQTVGDGFDRIGALVPPLVDLGRSAMARVRPAAGHR